MNNNNNIRSNQYLHSMFSKEPFFSKAESEQRDIVTLLSSLEEFISGQVLQDTKKLCDILKNNNNIFNNLLKSPNNIKKTESNSIKNATINCINKTYETFIEFVDKADSLDSQIKKTVENLKSTVDQGISTNQNPKELEKNYEDYCLAKCLVTERLDSCREKITHVIALIDDADENLKKGLLEKLEIKKIMEQIKLLSNNYITTRISDNKASVTLTLKFNLIRIEALTEKKTYMAMSPIPKQLKSQEGQEKTRRKKIVEKMKERKLGSYRQEEEDIFKKTFKFKNEKKVVPVKEDKETYSTQKKIISFLVLSRSEMLSFLSSFENFNDFVHQIEENVIDRELSIIDKDIKKLDEDIKKIRIYPHIIESIHLTKSVRKECVRRPENND